MLKGKKKSDRNFSGFKALKREKWLTKQLTKPIYLKHSSTKDRYVFRKANTNSKSAKKNDEREKAKKNIGKGKSDETLACHLPLCRGEKRDEDEKSPSAENMNPFSVCGTVWRCFFSFRMPIL